ncbi:ABC transporter substrate-binding protein [Arsukibacterium sp. MJ3]|uniref:ABC transporter substrate-binding protein n=1 Tax=Arsukibacterium sp. MJ3 TaxID=1632859 RepID=UPI00128D2AD6|nr:ABC transporter substrate-binding protein [Arsukibacterium sp. MJ3]
MTLKRNFVLTVSVLLNCLMPSIAQDREPNAISSINWVINTAPPFHILTGPLSGQGICDVLIDVVDAHLPELSTNRFVLPQTRIRQQFQREVDQCFPCMIYRPVPGETIQSDPTHFYYPHGIITTKEKSLAMQARHGNPVRLASLITDRSFRFGYPDGRHYPAVQSILDKAVQSDITRVAHTGENATVAILSMIKMERIDFTLDYQILHNFDVAENDATNLVFLDIAETQGQHVLGAIGCTNTEWGRAVVQQINRVLPEIRQDPEFLRVLGLWFNDDSASGPYRELLRERVWKAKE